MPRHAEWPSPEGAATLLRPDRLCGATENRQARRVLRSRRSPRKRPWHSRAIYRTAPYGTTSTSSPRRNPGRDSRHSTKSCAHGPRRRPPTCGFRIGFVAWSMNPIPPPSQMCGAPSGPSISWPIPTSAPVTTPCCKTRTLRRSSPTAAWQCVVSGELAEDGNTFFVRRLLSYLPDQRHRQFRAPLRRIEYFDGCALYRDSRRKAEVYIDPSLLPLGWDPTWNQWKHLVATKIGVTATFVDPANTGSRTANGIW